MSENIHRNSIIDRARDANSCVAEDQRQGLLSKMGALHNAILNSANFSSIATDERGIIQIFNIGAERMMGYSAAEVVDKLTPADISDPQELITRATSLSLELGVPIRPGFEALIFKASRGIEDIYELTYIRKNGSRFPAVVSVTALLDDQDAIIGYLLIGTDNTARKQLEAERAELAQRLADHQFYTRSLFESNIDAQLTTDLSGFITDVNRRMEELTGCTRDELIGTPFKSFFTDEGRAGSSIVQVLNNKKISDYDLTVRARNGKETLVSFNASTFFDRDRRQQGVIAAARDVTDRRLLDKVLKVSESRYRRLFETAQDGILLLNADTALIEDVNPYLIKMLGYTHTEFLGKKLWEVGPFADIAQSKEMFIELQTKGYVRYEHLPLRTIDGAKIDVEFVSNSYMCDDVKVIQCNIRDVTESKAAAAKIARQSKLYSALSQCNKAIIHSASEEHLFPQICRAAVEFGGMKMAWIGLIDPETLVVRPAASFGDDAGYIDGLTISVDAGSPFGGGITGCAIREKRPIWCQNFLTDSKTTPWRDAYKRAGIAATASLPLSRNGITVGVFCLFSGEVDSFDEAARDLLMEMASDISFALDNLAHGALRRQTDERMRAAEETFRSLVDQAIAGIFIIQDGKLAYVNSRCAEIVGQGSADDLIGTDAFLLIGEAHRDEVADSIRRLLVGETQSVALEFAAIRRDGVIIQVEANAGRATHEGRPAIIGTLQDISEKKRANDEIRKYLSQLKTAFRSSVDVATIISEMRDPYTVGHERRVAELAVAIGTELGLDEGRLEGLQVAGHLHDVGKITVPSEILTKPGTLRAAEILLIQEHPRAGYDVLKGVEFPWPVALVALQHHERMDGSGYPQGLKGDEILLESRIVAVADVVEAMFSHRPYRPGLGIEKALAEIERGRGAIYDIEVADACLHLFREKGYQLPT